MKSHLLLVFMLISTVNWSQSGFEVIRKAQRKVEQKNYKKALRLLDRAEKMDYGFCGNSWIEADEVIAQTRAQVYAETGRFELAANTLNEVDAFYISAENDSLKTVYYAEAFGKERVKRELDSCIALITSDSVIGMAFMEMSLNLDVRFSNEPFRINLPLESISFITTRNDTDNRELTALERFKIALREQPFYQVLR